MEAIMKEKLFYLAAVVLLSVVPAAAYAQQECTEKGFISIFNGKDLTGWDYDKRCWSVENGVIVGQVTKDISLEHNTFCIWQGGEPEDFILKLSFRIDSGNSGIQYRSKVVGEWVVAGYQAEIDNTLGDVGEMYEEKLRKHLVPRCGEFAVLNKTGEKIIKGEVANIEWLKKVEYYKPNQWNEFTIVARGNHIMQFINGFQTTELVDNDTRRMNKGILALQIHKCDAMKVEFKDIMLKELNEKYGDAEVLFNTENLDGWTYSGDDQKNVWSVRDGVICDSGNPPGYMRTEKQFTNFILHLQYRHLARGNSGVLTRINGPDKLWPRAIEAQGGYGHVGDIIAMDKFPMTTAKQRRSGKRTKKMHESNEREIGQWNDYEITLNGKDLQIRVNRLLQNCATDCEEIPGAVGLQSENGRMEFRNITLTPIAKQ